MATGGQDEAVLSSTNLPVDKFILHINSVCHLAIAENANGIDGQASGFLARFLLDENRKTVVVMNNHFIATKELAHFVVAAFRFEGKNECKMVKLDPEMFFRTSKELDYTFVGISQEDVNELHEKHDVNPVKLDAPMLAVQEGDIIHIPQHPNGKQKRISSSSVFSVTETDVYYKADTSFGSSGSPVLYTQSNQMFVLALHKAGGVTLTDGRLANRGILISAILAHVCQHSDNGERPSSTINEEAPTKGNQESGAYAPLPTTRQGLPVVQQQTLGNVSITNSDTATSSENRSETSYDASGKNVQVTENPVSAVVALPEPQPGGEAKIDPPPNQARQAVCPAPFEPCELIRIAERIANIWKSVAKKTTMFKNWQIENIACNHNLSDETMKADKMLTGFQSRLGTREVLAAAIREEGKADVSARVLSGFYINNTD